MARTPSTMPELGRPAPDFDLPNTVTGNRVRRADYEGQPLLVMFVCNHCPFVVHIREVMVRLANEYVERGVAVVAINANSLETHPQDGPAHMKTLAEDEGWKFPYAFDETQEVARACQAACTPDFFLYDTAHRLTYRGQLDDSRPGSGIEVTGDDLRAALENTLAGNPPLPDQKAGLGCNIKWNPANIPGHFG